jgi:tRNA-Thr(GGU) m(6)t(6)A37 methyltransferase TsaA
MSNPIARNGVVVAVSATILIIFNVAIVVCIRRRHSREISEVEKKFDEELKKERAQRGKERLGRISVQKKSRERLTQENLKSGYQYRPIGYVQSPFPDRRGCPRQPVLVPAALGKIKFDKSIIQFEHFKEIVQFSHIWVIFVFHDNTNGDTEADNIPARIKPPRLGGAKVGCLTTRSPHRPNAIGLSVCEIIDVGPDYISVCGIDMVDGTPVLDIKPYIPYDSIQLQSSGGCQSQSSPLPMAVAASKLSSTLSDGSAYKDRQLKVPSWIIDSDIPLHPVNFDDCAVEALDNLVLDKVMHHCNSAAHAMDLITQVTTAVMLYQLSLFCFSHHRV